MAKAFIDDTHLRDIADSIRGKLGVQTTYLPSEMAAAIDSIPTGGTEIEEKEVNFYDYEGTLVASYNKSEISSLTELPPLPDRTSENLFNQGWNMTIQDILERIDKGMYYISVGCIYRTLDDKTHIIVKPDADFPTIYLKTAGSKSADTIIDWGDGSATVTATTTQTLYTHTYSSQYLGIESDITITSATGVHNFTYYIGETLANNFVNKMIKIYLSSKARIAGSAIFSGLRYLEEITLHKNIIQDIGATNQLTYTLDRCVSLKHVNVPNITLGRGILRYASTIKRASIPKLQSLYYAFGYCYSLDKCEVLLDKGITTNDSEKNASIGYGYMPAKHAYIDERLTAVSGTFYLNENVEEIILPSTLETLNKNAFNSSLSLKNIYLKATLPPTLSGALEEPNSFYTIYVPTASYNDYIAAQYWSDIASHIQPYDFTVSQHALNFTMPNGGTITLSKTGTPTEVTLEYSLDNGITWTTWVETNNARTVTLTAGQTVHIRNTSATQTGFSTGSSNTYVFSASGELWANGDIRSLLCKTPENVSVLGDNCFLSLFYSCANLKSTPLLKGDVIGGSSLMRTFRFCTGLVLVRSFDYTSQTGFAACRGMFQGCTSLTSFPEIMIGKVGEAGFRETFYGCSNLKEIRAYIKDITASSALSNWFYNAAATGDFYCDQSLVIPSGASGIPTGWTRRNL